MLSVSTKETVPVLLLFRTASWSVGTEEVKDEGLVSDEEYRTQRQQILDDL